MEPLTHWLNELPEQARIEALNGIKTQLHSLSPFQ